MNFDRLAPYYRVMELLTAGGKLQRCRLAFVDEIPAPRRILLAGEGHGRSLPVFLRRFPNAEITVIDSSARMLEIARRSTDCTRVTFVHADLLDWEPPAAEFDLIVTNFFLDCFPEPELAVVIARLGRWAARDADWLLADFQIPEGRLAGLRSRAIVAMLYVFFGVVCNLRARSLVSPDAHLKMAGFSLNRRITRDWGLLKSEWWRR